MTSEPPNGVATSATPEFSTMDSAPWGKKCILLTSGGISVIGVARKLFPYSLNPSGYVAWAPLPRIPAHIKGLIK